MEKSVEVLISRLYQIANDHTSGSLDLVYAILDAFYEMLSINRLYMDGESVNYIRKSLEKLTDKQGCFVSVFNVIRAIKQTLSISQNNLSVLFSCLDSVRNYYDNLPDKQTGIFLNSGFNIHRSILVHSNSRSVKSFLLSLQKKGKTIQKIYQTVSVPGEEGLIQAKFLQTNGFSVEIVDDGQVKKIISDIDTGFFGADIISPDSFINKVKTKSFCELLKAAGKPVIVIADKNKKVNGGDMERFRSSILKRTNKQGTSLFEDISKDLVDKYIIPE